VDSHVNRIIISTAIDNLGKGAAGQAIQNANLMCNFAEDAGLKLAGVR
jgi:N-acetyl-gamma-glutamyl-phosphate reductase